MSLLDRIQSPADLRQLKREELDTLASDLRERMVDVCSRTGGHIGAGLGVVELTIALHYAFRTPRDQLVWDVGHQGYPHKFLTGRNAAMETLRQENGVSGFLKRTESEFDIPPGLNWRGADWSDALDSGVAIAPFAACMRRLDRRLGSRPNEFDGPCS